MKTKAISTLISILISLSLLGAMATVAVAELKIDSVYPTLGALSAPLDITVLGSDFDTNTRISMALDSGNRLSVTGSVSTPDFASDVVISGNRAYVADKTGDLQVIDISDPENPQIIAAENTPGSALGIALSGAYAFIADGQAGLSVVDISNPLNPQLSGNGLDTASEARAITIEGDQSVYCR